MAAPIIDSRDMQSLVEQLKEIYPYYTPEWRFSPEDPDPGTALFLIFAEMFGETIRRFNRVPDKNYLAFLNLLNLKALSSKPARGYLCFTLSAGTSDPVYIPEGTQVTANASDGGQPVVFETERDIMLTPAALRAAFNVHGEEDRIGAVASETLLDIKNPFKKGFTMFDYQEENLQQHVFYLAQQDLFNVRATALLQIEIVNSLKQFKEKAICEKLADPAYVEWSYGTEDGWEPFDHIACWGNLLDLEKRRSGQIALRELEGNSSRWIRCRVKERLNEQLADIDFNNLRLKAKYIDCDEQGGLLPDRVYYNDIEVEAGGAYPFGEFFALYDNFYISCQEAFSKKGAMITLAFILKHHNKVMNNDNSSAIEWKMIMRKSDLEEPERPRVFILKTGWEYWNGQGWVKLSCAAGAEDIFLHPAAKEKVVTFTCPEDIAETMVGAQENYWIRARVLSIHNIYVPDGIYQAPWVENIRLQYEYRENSLPVQHCWGYNNLQFRDYTRDLGSKDRLVWPFYGLDINQPAFYMGFDQAPVKGPISIFFSLKIRKEELEENAGSRSERIHGVVPEEWMLEWEYLQNQGLSDGWVKLNVLDETHAFSQSGSLVFAGSPDYAKVSMFGQELYWIRVVNREAKWKHEEYGSRLPRVKGIYINTVGISQQESIPMELLDTSSGAIKEEYTLASNPVLSEEIWVDEARSLTDQEKKELRENNYAMVREVGDEWGNIREFWIRWTAVEDFFSSGPQDRHYCIDRLAGTINFGNGRNGKIPPLVAGLNTIQVSYKTGGGQRGNLDALEIKQLSRSLAYIDEIFNPEATFGGCDRETHAQVVKRGPQLIKHQNRAVTASDFECLARQASLNIAQVKCLPRLKAQGARNGSLILVVLPRGGVNSAEDFSLLRQEVQKYLAERTPVILNKPGSIKIIEPVYLEISVYAVVVIDELEAMARVDKEARERLDSFLSSPAGDALGKTWEIGEFPHMSIFYTLLKSVSAVNYVEKVSMTVYRIGDEGSQEIDANKLADFPHGMVVNGKHRIVVKNR